MLASQGNHDVDKKSSVFDSPCSSVSSVSPDKQDTVIVAEEENEIDLDEQLTTGGHDTNEILFLSNVLRNLAMNSEVMVAKPNLPIRLGVTAIAYDDLRNTEIIKIQHPTMTSGECITKRQIYLSEPYLSSEIPIRTRVLDRSSSLLGFILEKPCLVSNNSRYLVLDDSFAARYYAEAEFHLCLCQDFRRHLLNIDYKELRTFYQLAFETTKTQQIRRFTLGEILRVKKFDGHYHRARVLEIDCSLVKICFFERKSQKQMWIHTSSSIIEEQVSPPAVVIVPPPDTIQLRKRKSRVNKSDAERKRLRDRSHADEAEALPFSPESRPNLLTAYYTNILLPKFRVLNSLPSSVHKCSQQCVAFAEGAFSSHRIQGNPFLLPFECHWSIVDSKPRGYRTPCRRTLYSLDDIDQYLYHTQSKLSIKFFVDGVLNRFQPPLDTFDRKFLLNDDLSNGKENVTISVYNDVDHERPSSFVYVTQVRPIDQRIAAALYDTNATSCCDCTDNCNDRMKCACFRKTLEQARVNGDPLVMAKDKHHYTDAYMLKTNSYQRKRLFSPISSGIYECHSKCSCHREHCSNRLVQQGLFVHLQLFKDKSKGWGLRTLHDLPRGTFICQYIGELLTSDQGHERAQSIDDKYQTSLDLVQRVRYKIGHDDDDDDRNEPYVLDGSLYSNLGRYFNHSCDPNMFIQNVFIDTHDLHFPNLALFTQTHIKAGQELTWHYNCELLPDREVKCCCGSKNCRGRLL